ncbi:hypothetical protein [Streptomyces sp. NBC_01006]|uniref:hypothetical protein n=1 Tax=Streptomyces sp. NBC_01006 TaxID=2903716 RepID=UPI003867D0E9|nr:hypothetical protein OG509_02035 [Streptomyces sp. NBC_01006]
MKLHRRARAPLAALAAGVTLSALLHTTARAQESGPPAPVPSAKAAADSMRIPAPDRDKVLGKGWQKSADRAWTTSGDGTGFHVLTAVKRDGYAWRTAATLSEPGFDADTWIGNACVTGSGTRAVVAYAPRTFTNKPDLMARGAFAAIVNLETGAVTKLAHQVSLAYFSPGCGTGEKAVFTQAGDESRNATRLITVDAATGTAARPLELAGQVTSAVPVGDAIVAADANRLVRITADGNRTQIARTQAIPFLLKPDAQGGVVYMDRGQKAGSTGRVLRVAATGPATVSRVPFTAAAPALPAAAATAEPQLLATGELTGMDLTSSATGHVYVTGKAKSAATLPATVHLRPDAPADSVATTRGESLVTRTAWADGNAMATSSPGRPTAVTLATAATGKPYGFTVGPNADALSTSDEGSRRSPALPGPDPGPGTAAHAKGQAPAAAAGVAAAGAAAGGGFDDAQRYCAVARNDPAKQAIQPKPRQVEWAVDQAITGNLNKWISRPANWKNLGMAAYQPQFLFPLHDLDGGGRIPAQVMLGITAQESNMWQASRVVVPGVTGNALIGNYYGIKYASNGQQVDPWGINWAEADCGYGVTQVTDGMRLAGKEKTGETAMSVTRQEAVALDYTANIAAGVNILADKWNDTRRAGLVVNNGDPKYLENWFFALWAYNSGFYPQSKAGDNHGAWGVGFTNNPANPLWKANRRPFLQAAGGGDNYADAAHPQDWPYQEKVLGWAARPLSAMESPGTMVAGYRQAWWNNDYYRTTVKPPEGLFCTADNQCDPSKIGPDDSNDPGKGACTRDDLYCWWHQPVTWKNCANGECGSETLRFNATYPEEADGTAYPPNCGTGGLPADALIVDDVPAGTPVHRPNCTVPTTTGTFSLDFGSESAQIDLHQLGAGFGGHFWFGHTRADDETGRRLKLTGTWNLGRPMPGGQAKVLVHLPDHGAQTQEATYEVKTTQGWQRVAPLNQLLAGAKGTNRWVELGAYQFNQSVPEVRLSSWSVQGKGSDDIAFDAVAFVPGDYSGMPSISFPDDNPNAPDIDYDVQPLDPASAPVFTSATLPGAAKALSSAAAETPQNCADAMKKAKAGKSLCVRQGAPAAAPAQGGPTQAPPAAGAAAPGAGASCPLRQNVFNRYLACFANTTPIEVVLLNNGKPVGSAFWNIEQRIQLYKDENSIDQTITINALKVDPALASVTVEWEPKCTGACTTGKVLWNGSPTWVTGVDQHSSTVGAAQYWTGTTGVSQLNLSWQFTFRSPSSPDTGILNWSDPDAAVRCDVIMGNEEVPQTKPGCVFNRYVPTRTLNTAKRPAANALYWLLMEKLKSHPGSKKYNSPLHRLADETAAQKNRDKICDSTFVPHPTGTADKPSCDEYPFAKSRESGGSTLTSGKECAQFYAEKSGNRWQLKYDPNFNLPTWQEPCGRGSIPLLQNTGAGGEIGRFTTAMRLHDGDAYFLDVPGFANCSPTSCDLP